MKFMMTTILIIVVTREIALLKV